ncbi:hypothetical protein GOP47_0021586 [Adiantum capillus-veneris]|uniref:RNB domain-containing protein n=1 Tax=Adiantum capillus-veneris TaxID=13818 RepID=A0A9D4Z6E1_ADICA|nr:hypothetical protein GOP47_0021586 [Adiantum capillus-veneris]
MDPLSATLSTEGIHGARPRRVYLQAGTLVEFEKDSGEIALGVTQNREGKKSWIVLDQNAATCTVRTKQVNVVVPGGDNFKPEDISELLRQVEPLQDQTCLEVAWEKLLTSSKVVDLEELALVLYGSTTPGKCYSAYRLLISCPLYFECIDDGFSPLYEPRSLDQVRQLRLHALGEEIAHKKMLDFAAVVKSAMQLPFDEKPKRSLWDSRPEFKSQLESLKTVALETGAPVEKKKCGMQVLDVLGTAKNSAAAIDVMVQMGYFGIHENFELLKLDMPVSFPKCVIQAVKAIKTNLPDDLDKENRIDLTSLKVFSIDTEQPNEIDDGLSAIKLPDGRFKVWIHVADPTRWVAWDSALQKEASSRGTSIYLPTMTVPMFPMDLTWDLMSLRQGQCHPAISISAIFSSDGSVAEACVTNSVIRSTYNLSYAAATELISLNTKEETELSILYQVAVLRRKWRLSHGASSASMPRPRICVEGEETANPKISITVDDGSSPSSVLVTEMMILCGEIIAKYGGKRGLSLPYRCQAQHEELNKHTLTIPEGPARSSALLRSSSRVDMNFLKPLQHASLGLLGYVQFTSPIRRYADLLAHFQIKAVLRGKEPLFLPGFLETSLVSVSDACRQAKKLQIDGERYWILEYLRREPRNRKYQACVIRFVKSTTTALVLLTELGLQNLMDLRIKRQLGEEFSVRVVDSQPRNRYLQLREC